MMKTYQNKTSREDGKNVGCMNERRKVVNSGNMRRQATSDANAHKFNNTRLLKEKCKAKRCGEQGSNLIFFVVFPVDVEMMNSSQTKGIKLTDQPTRNLIPLDRVGVPDLSVRWIISIGGGGDSRDPTTNEQLVAP
jgi:hypothetical protein